MSHPSSASTPQAIAARLPRAHVGAWLALGSLTIALIAADAWLYARQRDRTLARTEQMLGQFAEQKSRELETRLEALSNSLVITSLDEPIAHDLSVALLSGRGPDAAERQRIGRRLAVWRAQHGFLLLRPDV